MFSYTAKAGHIEGKFLNRKQNTFRFSYKMLSTIVSNLSDQTLLDTYLTASRIQKQKWFPAEQPVAGFIRKIPDKLIS